MTTIALEPSNSGLGRVTLKAPITDSSIEIELPSQSGPLSAFPSGTKMLFIQTTAPVGWTKDTTHNNKALRVVSGTAGSGGTLDFTAAFAAKTPTGTVSVSGTVGTTVLSVEQMPSHAHQLGFGTQNGPGGSGWNWKSQNAGAVDSTYGAGSSWGHNHSFSGSGSFSGTAIDLAVKYVDAIIATKD